MKHAFIFINPSSNNPKLAEIEQLVIIVTEDGGVSTVWEHNFISQSEHNDLVTTKEIVSTIKTLLQNTKPIFFDRLSELLFREYLSHHKINIFKSSQLLTAILKRHLSGHLINNLEEYLDVFQVPVSAIYSENAKALCEKYFQLLEDEVVIEDTSAFAKANTLKNYSTQQNWLHIPKTAGVYYFKNNAGMVIYVGKAVNLRERVRSHSTSKVAFEYNLMAQTVEVDYKETGNELIALLLESEEIARLKPIYNTQQKDALNPWVITSKKDAKGILRLRPEEKVWSDFSGGLIFNKAALKIELKKLQLLYNLCPRFIGLERTSGSCSSPRCNGICRAEEGKDIYNERVKRALLTLEVKKESFYIDLKGRTPYERSFVLVKEGIYLGYGFIPNDYQVTNLNELEVYLQHQEHTYFTSRSISQHLKKRGVQKVEIHV